MFQQNKKIQLTLVMNVMNNSVKRLIFPIQEKTIKGKMKKSRVFRGNLGLSRRYKTDVTSLQLSRKKSQ